MIQISIFEWVTILVTYAVFLFIIYYQFRAMERRDARIERLIRELVRKQNDSDLYAGFNGKTRQRGTIN